MSGPGGDQVGTRREPSEDQAGTRRGPISDPGRPGYNISPLSFYQNPCFLQPRPPLLQQLQVRFVSTCNKLVLSCRPGAAAAAGQSSGDRSD